MNNRSFPLFVLSVLGLFLVALCDLGTVPGNAGWSGRLSFQTNSTPNIRYVAIPQNVIRQEWKNLGTTFTIETWFLVNPPASDPLGRWNDTIALTGEAQFIPLLSRHPGDGLANQWAHFAVQLTRTGGGLVLAAFSGCGCASPPLIVNGSQVGLSNCGYGYRLNSDSNRTIGGPVYITPNRWTHLALSFDGDNTDLSKTRTASLYINGNLVLTNTWADPLNQPRSANRSTCVDKPMQWFHSYGDHNSIKIGYLDNQDFNAGRVVQNPDPSWNFYGFDGLIDDLRIWRNVRTAAQIKANYDVALTARDLADDNLVALYSFNEGPYASSAMFANSKTGNIPTGIIYDGNTTANSAAAYGFWQSSGSTNALLNLKTKVWSRGTLPSTPRMVFDSFTLPVTFTVPVGETSTPILAAFHVNSVLRVLDFSPLLRTNLGVSQANITFAIGGAQVNIGSTVNAGQALQVNMRCGDSQCSNLAGAPNTALSAFPWRDLNLTYTAGTNNLTSTVYFQVYPDCDGLYDACGVCNGDNRTCQCVVYHEFKNVRMSYVLLTFMVDFLIDKVSTTTQILDETLDKVNNLISTNTPIPTAADQTQQLMTFYNGCLTNYCQSVTRFLQLLVSTNAPLP